MRKAQRVAAFLVMLVFVGVCAGVVASQTGSTPTSNTVSSSNENDNDEDAGEVRGQADDAPRYTGLIVGLLFIAIVSLLFAAYMRGRH